MTGDIPPRQSRVPGILAPVILVVVGLVIAWPILRGGYETYLDNPCHLAEIHAAAFEARSGWSDVAICGLALGDLHAPVLYRPLAWLARQGGPANALYAACLVIGFLLPALAVYRVSRRSVPAWASASLAVVLLLQRPSIVGISSALGGMWTFHVAAAVWVLLVDQMARTRGGVRDAAVVAALTGAALCVHLFALVPIALLAIAHAWVSLARARLSLARVAGGLGAVVLGAIGAAFYWVPAMMSSPILLDRTYDLAPRLVFARLLVPTDMIDLVAGAPLRIDPAAILSGWPMLLLVVGGVAGVGLIGRRRDDTPLYGAMIAVAILALLTVVAPEFHASFLGPLSYRMIYFGRIGLALAAVPAVAALAGRLSPRRALAPVAIVLAVAAGFGAGAPLRDVVPSRDSDAVRNAHAMWEWLASHRGDDWGRVYVQDTFDRGGSRDDLRASHYLALTARESGVRQLGAWYGALPFVTAEWTVSEFGTLFGRAPDDPGAAEYCIELMELANVTHVVAHGVRTSRWLLATGEFERVASPGGYVVLRRRAPSQWVYPLVESAGIVDAEFATGRVAFETRGMPASGSVLVKGAFHPFWRSNRVRLEPTDLGMMLVAGVSDATGRVTIEYRPPAWPVLLSALAWLAIVGIAVVGRRGT